MTEATVEVPILAESKDGVFAITLNRPKSLNALSHQLITDLHMALKRAEKDPAVRCVTLTGVGRAFSSGADLADLKKMYEGPGPVSLGHELRHYFNPMALQIRRMEKPVVAAVNGTAAGAGASLAFACDVVVAGEGVKFISAFIQVGLAPDSGATYAMARGLGRRLALEYAWTGKPLMAPEAARFGLVNRVVPDAELQATVKEFVDRVCKMPPRAVALTKRAVAKAASNDFAAQLEYEAYIQDILGKTKDHREGVTAFIEGRPPVFRGE